MRHLMTYYLPYYLLVLFFGLNTSLFAQEEIAGDTLRELEIVGFSEQKFASGAVFSKPDSVLLSLYASESLGRLLQQSTGVYMKSYGSSRLSTAGFRGTSAEHTRLLWNGLPINSPTLGLSDLAIFPTLAFNDIQVHHGAGGALFGSGAIGGTIQLANQAEGRQKPSVTLHQGFGSFSWRQTNLQVKYGKDAWEGRTLMYYSESDNDFDIKQPNQVSRVQQNARMRLLGIIQDLYWTGKNTTFDSHLWYYSSDRMLPPPITRTTDDDRQWDRGWRWASNLQWKNALGHLAIQTGWMHDINHFKDYQTVDNTTTTDQWTIDTRQSFDIGTRMEGQVGVRTSLFHALGENLSNIWEERLAAYGLWRWQWKRLTASAQLRKEWVIGYDSPLTPALGLSWGLVKGVQIKAQVSQGYRIPTLNHRYWQPGGNPEIKPEHSLSYEGGLSWEKKGNKWGLEGQVQYFRMQVEDWIYWRPSNNAAYWSPDNISEVLLQGIELMATGKSKHWQWGLQYTLTQGEQLSQKGNDNAESRLFYVPTHKGNLWINWQINPQWQLTSNYQHTGMRYDIDRTSLPAFSTLDIAFRLQLKGKEWEGVSWLFKVDNLLDADYQNVVNYPMPGRNWKLQLEVVME